MENRLTKQTTGDDAPVNLRPVRSEDEPILFSIYASTRAPEMAAWGWDALQQDAFLRMQFMSQQLSYRAQFSEADHRLILLSDEPIGRLLVDRSETEIRLVDIALLPEHRNAGIGAALIEGLQEEAAKSKVPVRLHVLKSNPAARLYRRLGFSETGDDGVYLEMEWLAGAPSPLDLKALSIEQSEPPRER